MFQEFILAAKPETEKWLYKKRTSIITDLGVKV